MRTVTMKLQRPTVVSRIWYKRLGLAPPDAETHHGLEEWARLVPYRFRRFHQFCAFRFGLFWIPCVLCDRPFGGHEAAGSVPDPLRAPHGLLAICSDCTIRRSVNGGVAEGEFWY